MRRALTLLAATTAAITLSACGVDEIEGTASPAFPPASSSSSDPGGASSPGAPATSERAAPATSARGNIVKAVGEEGGFTSSEDPDSPVLLTFTVESITPDAPCDSGFDEPPANGHYVAIQLRVTTTADYDPSSYVSFSEYDFQVIGPDGITVSDVSGNAWSCQDSSSRFPTDPLGRGQTYVGTVVVDSPSPTGTLVYLPAAAGGTLGWEWTF